MPSGLTSATAIEELLGRCPQLSQIDVGVCASEGGDPAGASQGADPAGRLDGASPVGQLLRSGHAGRLEQLRIYRSGGEHALTLTLTPPITNPNPSTP